MPARKLYWGWLMWNQLHRDVEQAGSGVWSVILGLCQAQGYFVCGCVCVC